MPRITIRRLMIVVALFGLLFALPTELSTILGGLIVSGLIAWSGTAVLWRFLGWGSSTRGEPEDVTVLAIVALGLDVVSWLLFFLLAFHLPHEQGWRSIGIGAFVAIATVGSLVFVTALMTLVGPGEGRSSGMKTVAFFAAVTSWPFLIGLGFGLVSIVIRSLG